MNETFQRVLGSISCENSMSDNHESLDKCCTFHNLNSYVRVSRNIVADPNGKLLTAAAIRKCNIDLQRNDISMQYLGRIIAEVHPYRIRTNEKKRKGEEKRQNVYYKIRMLSKSPASDEVVVNSEPREDPEKLPSALPEQSSFNYNTFVLKERDDLLIEISKINEKRIFSSNTEIIEKTRMQGSDITTLHEIGRGSYGVAYKGILRRSNRAYETAVAIKCIKDGENPHMTRATITELKILHFFRVMKIPQVQYLYGAIFDEEKQLPLKVVTLFVGKDKESTTLSKVLSSDKKFEFTVVEFLKFCHSLCCGLLNVHKQGILHNDLKPNNVLVHLEDSSARLIDFGRSSLLHQAKRKSTKRDQLAMYWIAPEVNNCSSAPSIYSDIFSLGYVINYGISKFPECDSLKKLKLIASKCQSAEPFCRPPIRFVEHSIENLPEMYITYHK